MAPSLNRASSRILSLPVVTLAVLSFRLQSAMAEGYEAGPVFSLLYLKLHPDANVMHHRWLVLFVALLCWTSAHGNPIRNRPVLRRTSSKLAGQILDYTNNHGEDN